MIILASLGYFVFGLNSIPYQELTQKQSYRHPNQHTVGSDIPPSQYTGREAEEITLNATLKPEITGGVAAITLLQTMADTGKPYPLILGTGRVMGSYVITDISQTHKNLNHQGAAQTININISLKKVSEHGLAIEGQALAASIGFIRTLAGI